MPTIEKMTAAMFPEIYETLLRDLDPRLTRNRWELPFIDRGWHDEDHYGYMLLQDGRPVGILGVLFSKRQLGGKVARFCNLHAWYVKPEHRTSSLLLMRPVLALKDHSITDFSAAPNVVAISKRLGFQTLDNKVCLLPPLPWRGNRRVRITELNADPTRAERKLSDDDFCIYKDHQGLECSHLLVESGASYCYVVSNRIEARWLPHQQVHYISNRQLFAENHAIIHTRLLQNRTRYVSIGSRLLTGVSIPYSRLVDSQELLYRPAQTAPEREQIDTLYSELPLLKLCVHFDAVLKLRTFAQRLMPHAEPAVQTS